MMAVDFPRRVKLCGKFIQLSSAEARDMKARAFVGLEYDQVDLAKLFSVAPSPRLDAFLIGAVSRVDRVEALRSIAWRLHELLRASGYDRLTHGEWVLLGNPPIRPRPSVEELAETEVAVFVRRPLGAFVQ